MDFLLGFYTIPPQTKSINVEDFLQVNTTRLAEYLGFHPDKVLVTWAQFKNSEIADECVLIGSPDFPVTNSKSEQAVHTKYSMLIYYNSIVIAGQFEDLETTEVLIILWSFIAKGLRLFFTTNNKVPDAELIPIGIADELGFRVALDEFMVEFQNHEWEVSEAKAQGDLIFMGYYIALLLKKLNDEGKEPNFAHIAHIIAQTRSFNVSELPSIR